MKNIFLSFLLVAVVSTSLAAKDLFKGQWIDLTHKFSDEAIYWPTADNFKKTTIFQGKTGAGFYYTANNYYGAEHGGTHVDAPIHFYENGNTLDRIPLEQLIGPGVIIRIIEKVKKNRNYQFSIQDILDWEKEHGIIENDSILLIDTGSGKYWPDKKKYMGTDKRGEEGVKELKFPGIHPETAKFLVANRKIKAVGLDTPSIDYGGSVLFESHQILYKKNILGIENIANLDKLPIKGSMIIALPMKIQGGSGGPLRIVAFIPKR